MLIIAIFLLSLNACGYKSSPYYSEANESIEFILENNESCN